MQNGTQHMNTGGTECAGEGGSSVQNGTQHGRQKAWRAQDRGVSGRSIWRKKEHFLNQRAQPGGNRRKQGKGRGIGGADWNPSEAWQVPATRRDAQGSLSRAQSLRRGANLSRGPSSSLRSKPGPGTKLEPGSVSAHRVVGRGLLHQHRTPHAPAQQGHRQLSRGRGQLSLRRRHLGLPFLPT